MSIAIFYIVIVLILAAVVFALSVRAYNRRLDRVVRGEERDTHSSVPEPRTTVSVLYRTILMGVVIVSLLTVSALSGKVSSLQTALNELRSEQNSMSRELTELRQELEERDERVELFAWEVLSADLDSRKAELRFTVRLREYAEDTAVNLDLNGGRVSFRPGDFAGEFTGEAELEVFGLYDSAALSITEGGRTYTKTVDMPGYLFWELLPMPSMECRFSSGYRLGKNTCEGEYRLILDHTEDIQSVTVTYLTGGRELKTLDITAEALEGRQITLEKGTEIAGDLTFRIGIVTKAGYRIEEQSVMIYDTAYAQDLVEYERVTGPEGDLLWEEDRY